MTFQSWNSSQHDVFPFSCSHLWCSFSLFLFRFVEILADNEISFHSPSLAPAFPTIRTRRSYKKPHKEIQEEAKRYRPGVKGWACECQHSAAKQQACSAFLRRALQMFAFLRIFFLLRVKAKNKVNMWIALQTLALHSKEKKGSWSWPREKMNPNLLMEPKATTNRGSRVVSVTHRVGGAVRAGAHFGSYYVGVWRCFSQPEFALWHRFWGGKPAGHAPL